MTTTTARTVTVDGIGPVQLTVTQRGDGRPFLLLHGGAGLPSVEGFADLLAGSEHAAVLTPVHPGFGGTPRPEHLDSMKALALVYTQLLADLGLTEVTVVGNSIGGWIAAEMALLNSARVGSVVIIDGVGLRLEAHPIVDFFALDFSQVTDLSFYNPDPFRLDLAALPDEQKLVMAGNRAALLIYGGTTMFDPGLLERLPAIATPVLVVWGTADRIVPPEHGHAYADAIPGAQFHLIDEAGHLPQLETPDLLLRLVWDFAEANNDGRPTG
ncbi:MAG: hypothetical protein QOJ11_1191 [Frankiales bacterium]|jgi:pimeloyl-ACP methyl ester carboxylesterase|nr:hypothetical protein [Frankiales bacterium]